MDHDMGWDYRHAYSDQQAWQDAVREGLIEQEPEDPSAEGRRPRGPRTAADLEAEQDSWD